MRLGAALPEAAQVLNHEGTKTRRRRPANSRESTRMKRRESFVSLPFIRVHSRVTPRRVPRVFAAALRLPFERLFLPLSPHEGRAQARQMRRIAMAGKRLLAAPPQLKIIAKLGNFLSGTENRDVIGSAYEHIRTPMEESHEDR